MKRRVYLSLVVLIILSGLNTAALAQYHFRSFDPPGSVDTEPYGINNQGLISGQFTDSLGNGYGFVLDGSQFIILVPPGGLVVTAGGPNHRGQVPVAYSDANGVSHSAIWKDGVFTSLPDLPDYTFWGVNAINDEGVVVGVATNDPDFNTSTGFLYVFGFYLNFDQPQAQFFNPTGLNDEGQIVGAFTDSSGKLHGFLEEGAVFTTIDYPGSESTWTYGINNRHVIAGRYAVGSIRHGFLLHEGEFKVIDYPGAVSTWATYVNERGEVVGFYRGTDGYLHGFAAIPHKRK